MTVTSRLEGMEAHVAIKAPCRAATTSNITLSGSQTVDGVSLSSGDRVLVKNQTDAADNGIWVAGSGDWERALDFNGSRDAVGGTQVFVTSGTVNGSSYWKVDGSGTKSIGTDDIDFSAATVDDSASVAYDPARSGAVSTTVAAFLKRIAPITPEDYGAAGDATIAGAGTDDTTAVQAAFDAAVSEGRRIYLPNRYKITSTITWRKIGDSQGPIIYGDGAMRSGLLPAGLSGSAALVIDGSSLDAGSFARNGTLRDFAIFPGYVNGVDRGGGYVSAGTSVAGLSVIGMLEAEAVDLLIEGMTGDGVVFPLRTDISTNPDDYQSKLGLRSCYIGNCGGWGVNGDAGSAAISAIEKTRILICAKGGARVAGGRWALRDSSIAYCGGPTYGGGGVLVEYVNATPHHPLISGCEIDGNYLYNVWIKSAVGPCLIDNRFNSGITNWPDDDFIRPAVGVKMGFDAARSVTQVYARRNNFRSKFDTSDPETGFTAWQLDSGTGRFGDADIDMSRYDSPSTNQVKYARGGGALLVPTISGGAITGATVSAGGTGYSGTVSVVAVDPTSAGSGFSGTAVIAGEAVSGLTIGAGGASYSASTYLVVKPDALQGLSTNDLMDIKESGVTIWKSSQTALVARATAAQNIEASGAAKADKAMVFESEVSDRESLHNPSTGETTIPLPGVYSLDVRVTTDLGAAGTVTIWAEIAGVEVAKAIGRTDATGNFSASLSDRIVVGAAGQKLIIYCENSSGSAKALTGGNTMNRFSLALA